MIGIAPDKDFVLKQIADLVPPGAPEPRDAELLARLTGLTADLIEAYKAAGKLTDDPLRTMRERRIPLYRPELEARLKDKVVLVTGGAGCVGQQLLALLRTFGLKKLISVDIAYTERVQDTLDAANTSVAETHHAADVRDLDGMDAIFRIERPDVVFHLAAQRRPDIAELCIRETLTTNVFGTENIITLCERFDVRHCIYASTGKCFSYFTSNVYAASKKLGEFQMARATQQSTTIFSLVRFTHILDNSLVNAEIEQGLAQGIVGLHGPERYINVQNVHEATSLLLNALALAQPEHRSSFLTVNNIGWPVSTLEIALYRIDRSQRPAAIYFLGVPDGYDSQFFKGQFDWSSGSDVHPLINALEAPFTVPDASGSMLISETQPFCSEALTAQLRSLHQAVENGAASERQLKDELIRALRAVVITLFEQVSTASLLHILTWGLNIKLVQVSSIDFRLHTDIVTILLDELVHRIRHGELLGAENSDLYRLAVNSSPLLWWFNWRYVRRMDEAQASTISSAKTFARAGAMPALHAETARVITRLIALQAEQPASDPDSGAVQAVTNGCEIRALEIQLADLVAAAYGISEAQSDPMWKKQDLQTPSPAA